MLYVKKYAKRAVGFLDVSQGFWMGSDSESIVERGRGRMERFAMTLVSVTAA